MNVLFIYDDIWHPAEVIDRGLASFEEKLELEDIHFDKVMCAKDILTPEMIRKYPVIVCAKGNSINASNTNPWFEKTVTEVMPEDFEAFVREGGGFLALHAGNAFGKDSCREYTDFIGNTFITHPLRCPVTYTPVKENPITKGVGEFTQRDEHYILEIEEGVDPFLTSSSEPGGVHTAGYIKTIGKGKVVCLTPGHTLSVWQDPSFQTLFINALHYLNDR